MQGKLFPGWCGVTPGCGNGWLAFPLRRSSNSSSCHEILILPTQTPAAAKREQLSARRVGWKWQAVKGKSQGHLVLAPAWVKWGPGKCWAFSALMETRIKDSKHSSGANTALRPYSPHIKGQGEKRLLMGLLPRCDVPGCCLQPSQKLFKRSNQITPWLNLSHILFATSSSSPFARLAVCLHSH